MTAQGAQTAIPAAGPETRLAAVTRGTRLFGYAVAAVFFFGFGSWAALAPLAGASVAPGVVSPDGYRKTVQHLEGGIIRSIHVRSGDEVRRGELLLTLQDTRAVAEFREVQDRILHLRAAEARLSAEEIGLDSVSYPRDLQNDDAAARTAMAGQTALFAERRATRLGREKILTQRVAQLREEIRGLEEIIAAQDDKLRLIETEIANVRTLYEKGLARLPRLLELRREQADIRAQKASNKASIARNEQKIGETELERLTLRQQDKERVSEELTQVRIDLSALTSQLPSRADVLDRTLIRAPIDGRIMNLRVTTEAGGVIGPGEPILDIVPLDGGVVIDARVKPVDIDTVKPGMTARVMLTAYRQRSMPQIEGHLRSISGDRLVDDRTGEPYFLAQIEVDPADLSAAGEDIRMMPGMPAEVMILTGDRTMLDYLAQPLTESLFRSFREQ